MVTDAQKNTPILWYVKVWRHKLMCYVNTIHNVHLENTEPFTVIWQAIQAHHTLFS